MTDYAIRAEGICKEYVIGARERSYRTFRESIADAIAAPLRRLRLIGQEPPPEERFWALQDVSFDVKAGDVVGVIGRNGAGKSTLLRILSRITAPTKGRVEIRGRVASLLEVGTGFHPELTGRENIYLNGAILGMSRAEITRKFDAIVAFAEIERFLDTPVKRYSSGMYVRLAFAVAAHLEPEILVVDEVLAVGDSQFQKKCLGKMGDLASREGRTVLFVSHNLSAIRTLCSTAILLERGGLVANDVAAEVINHYLAEIRGIRTLATFKERHKGPSIIRAEVDEAELLNGNLVLSIEFDSPVVISPVIPGLILYNEGGSPIFGSNPRIHPEGFALRNLNRGVIRFEARDLPIAEGTYVLSLWLSDWYQDFDYKPDVLSLNFRPRNPPARPIPPELGPLNWSARWQA